jgi:hypothetical protein
MALQAYPRRVTAGEGHRRYSTAGHDAESFTRHLEDSESVSESLTLR